MGRPVWGYEAVGFRRSAEMARSLSGQSCGTSGVACIASVELEKAPLAL